jgi:diguanylate cyclase (GGDEF)-like protein
VPEDHRSADPLYVLSAAAEALARGPDLDASLATLLGTGAEAVMATAGAIYLQDPDRTLLEPLLAIGISDEHLALLGEIVTEGSGSLDPAVRAVRDGAATTILDRDGIGIFGKASGCSSASFLPLVANRGGIDYRVGILVLGWLDTHELSAAEEEILGALADLAAVAIDRARLASLIAERAEWFERLAHSDPLTGLPNQRTFARVLELEIARAGRQGSEVSVAVLDIDGFQLINDEDGHEAGDDVLRSVAGLLADSVRLVDTVARHGGDEFVVIAPGSAGMTVARRIQAAVQALPPAGGRPISVSIGIARFPRDGASGDDLVAAAGSALDDARTSGPGRIHEASQQPA